MFVGGMTALRSLGRFFLRRSTALCIIIGYPEGFHGWWVHQGLKIPIQFMLP
jgi:hypothetical protein